MVKVENPGGGDHARGWGPPFAGDDAVIFHAMNRGKQGITVDLHAPAEVARLRRLIRDEADVVIQNLRPGTLPPLGLAAAALLAEQPALICCDIGAYGRDGPLRERPGYDPMVQAFGGLMSLLGEDGRPPVRVAVSIMDIGTGMWAAIGILAALAERQRSGRGGVVDTSLFETSCAWMTIPLASYLASGVLPGRAGSGVREIAPYQAFAAADGHIMVGAGNDALFGKLCAALGQPGLAADARFARNAGRVQHRAALVAALQAAFDGDSVAGWCARLEAAGVPCSPVQTLDAVVAHPQTAALGMIQTLDGLCTIGLPLRFDGARPDWTHKAPRLGEHTAAVLPEGGEAP